MKRRPVLVSLLAPLLALGGPAIAADKILTVGAAVFPDSLRSGTSSFASLSLMTQTNDLLVARDNKGDLHPALALRWETIDPLTMRFHLRQGVTLEDGVTAPARVGQEQPCVRATSPGDRYRSAGVDRRRPGDDHRRRPRHDR